MTATSSSDPPKARSPAEAAQSWTAPKRQVTLRLDQEVLDGFRETGPGWQGRINETLRKSLKV